MADILAALGMVAEPFSLACLVFGVWVGIMFGAMPGLSVNMGLALLLPLGWLSLRRLAWRLVLLVAKRGRGLLLGQGHALG